MARRKTEVFGLSFMDCICCGFGAIILLFTILNASSNERAHVEKGALMAEVLQRERMVKDAQARKVELKNALHKIDEEKATAQGLSTRLIQVVQELEVELAARQQLTVAQKEHLNKLKADLKSMEEGNKRLSGGIPSDDVPGESARAFVGDGDRQYLTGLRVGGKRILFLVDGSASMLADTVVNVVRRRNLSDAARRKADKWVHTTRSLDWLTTQVPRDAKFQVYVFDTRAHAAIPGTDGVWLDARDGHKMDQAVAAVKSTAPAGGTSLQNAFASIRGLNPLPDNVILLTDGLPTQGATPPPRGTISGRERLRLYERAIEEIPRGVTINTILFPMEGDPMAAVSFWKLAMATQGILHDAVAGLAVRRRRVRREIEVFSLSFLDCICCGFGAMILLLCLVKINEPKALEASAVDKAGLIAKLEEELAEIRGDTTVLQREMDSRVRQLSNEREGVARLRGDLSKLQGEFKASQELSSVQEAIEGRLLLAQQQLTDEQKRLQEKQSRPRPKDNPVGGIPVDSEYVVFVIDTSGSMFTITWPLVNQKMTEVLDAYPQVKGIQVMNDQGHYMFGTYAGKWIPDTPSRRKAVLDRLRDWNAFSASSPAEGIEAAIRTFARPDQKMSIFVFGDEFTGKSIEEVVQTVQHLNHRGEQRRVRIHAIGFPTMFSQSQWPEKTGVRFATLMRALCDQNGGAFVGLNSVR